MSFGQWQKLALARWGSCAIARWCWCWMNPPRRWMRRQNTRYSSATRRPRAAEAGSRSWYRIGSVRCVWPISIVVLDGARVVEVGSHEALLAKGGQYAELYGIQAAAYR